MDKRLNSLNYSDVVGFDIDLVNVPDQALNKELGAEIIVQYFLSRKIGKVITADSSNLILLNAQYIAARALVNGDSETQDGPFAIRAMGYLNSRAMDIYDDL
jgi:hypothetical protein